MDSFLKDASYSKVFIGLTVLLDSIVPGLKSYFPVVGGDNLRRLVHGIVSGLVSVVTRNAAQDIVVKGAAVVPKTVGGAVGGVVSVSQREL